MRFCWARGLFIIVIAILSISSLLSACGKPGDLYLPEQPTEAAKP